MAFLRRVITWNAHLPRLSWKKHEDLMLDLHMHICLCTLVLRSVVYISICRMKLGMPIFGQSHVYR